jgi:coenzyme F420 hydrogenase subunit beta
MEKTSVKKSDLTDFLWESREEGFTALEHEVIYRELCSGCGLCVAACPEDVIGFVEYPKLIGKCTNCGYCLMVCPRSFLPKDEMEEQMFGRIEEEIGVVEGVYAVKARDNGQDGGLVTALLKYMLKSGLIDGAVVSKIDPKKAWKPLPAVATTAKEIVEAAGSRYSTSTNLSVLKDAKQRGLKKVAVVGTACHLDGIAKLKQYPVEGAQFGDLIKYSISLFCKSNFIYSMLKDILEEKYDIELKNVSKMDIKGKNLLVHESGHEKKIPLKDIRGHMRLGCKVCDDFTGRFADFAVGSVDSPEGYSTVITRTKESDKILKDMKKQGLVEIKDITTEELPVLKKLTENKKKSARKAITIIVREELPLPLKFLWE